MPQDWNSIAQNIHNQLREGRGSQARASLLELKGEKIPDSELHTIASLARRAGIAEYGVQLLHSIIRETRRTHTEASEEQKLEYAACLNRIGSNAEALKLLETIDAKQFPSVLLQKALILATQWRYRENIDLLKSFSKVDGLPPYERLVGLVNLADALVYERHHEEARPLLLNILHETSVKKLYLLHGNALQIAGLNEILGGRYDTAREFLDRAKKALKQTDTLDSLFVEKWRAILHLVESKGSPEALTNMNSIRDKAIARSHWETLRDCDRFVAIETQDSALLHNVYFGTPHDNFRERLLKDYKGPVDLPERYLWVLKGTSKPSKHIHLDPFGNPSDDNDLKPGHLLHRVLSGLCKDFYKPARIAYLFYVLYPEEYFHPVSSRAKVHEGLRRLRQWISEKGLPLEIEERDSLYKLTSSESFGIWVTPDETSAALPPKLKQLKKHWPESTFSIRETCQVLDISRRSAQRLLGDGVKKGTLERSGKGASTRYKFAS